MKPHRQILFVAGLLAAASAAPGAWAEPGGSSPAFDPTVMTGVAQWMDGVSAVYGENRPNGRGGSSAMSPVMAMSAQQRATIDRIRSSMGGAADRPTVQCDPNVNIGSTAPSKSPQGNQTWVNTLIVVDGGACAAGKNKL